MYTLHLLLIVILNLLPLLVALKNRVTMTQVLRHLLPHQRKRTQAGHATNLLPPPVREDVTLIDLLHHFLHREVPDDIPILITGAHAPRHLIDNVDQNVLLPLVHAVVIILDHLIVAVVIGLLIIGADVTVLVKVTEITVDSGVLVPLHILGLVDILVTITVTPRGMAVAHHLPTKNGLSGVGDLPPLLLTGIFQCAQHHYIMYYTAMPS